jgi:protocatechuate 3,4-dioxygenase beta subunit
MDHSIKRKTMTHRKMEREEEIKKQSAADIRETAWPPPAPVSSAPMFIKSLQMGFIGLFLCVANAWAGPADIQGIVKDAKGQPIKNADVRIESRDGKQVYNTAKTDAKGRYISQGLQPGVYRVSLVVNGAVKASITNTKAKADQTTQLNFDLRPLPATQVNAVEKKGKHMVWVPPSTGTHTGGRWVEVPDGAAEPGALNVQRANADELQRQAQSMGARGGGGQ